MPKEKTTKSNPSISINPWWLVVLLIGLLGSFIIYMRPWEGIDENARTYRSVGESVIEQEPDRYTFNPSFTFKSTESELVANDLARQNVNQTVQEIVALGVEKGKITSEVYTYERYQEFEDQPDGFESNANIRVVIETKEMAQKVQDFLATKDVNGRVTPQTSFSRALLSELQSQARAKAIKDARDKAQEVADGLDLKLGDVLHISENNGYSQAPYPVPYGGGDYAVAESLSSYDGFEILPGQDEYVFSIVVDFELK